MGSQPETRRAVARYSMIVENGVVTEVNVEENIFDHAAGTASKLLAPERASATA